MNSFLKVLMVAFGSVAVMGCAPGTEPACDVTPDSVFTAYTVSYDATSNTSTASATFTFGMENLTLDSPASITENNVSLTKNTDIIGNVSYIGSVSGSFNTHTFTFTDCNGKVHSNSVTMNPISFTSPGTISKAAGTSVSFNGPIGANESVLLSFQFAGPSGGQPPNVPSEVTSSNSGAVSIQDPAGNFSQATTGSWQVDVSRTVRPTLQDASSAGGSISATYNPAWQAVTINP